MLKWTQTTIYKKCLKIYKKEVEHVTQLKWYIILNFWKKAANKDSSNYYLLRTQPKQQPVLNFSILPQVTLECQTFL